MYRAQTLHTVQTKMRNQRQLEIYQPETFDIAWFAHFVHLYRFVHYVLLLGMRLMEDGDLHYFGRKNIFISSHWRRV